jgi:L-lactate dehydrogenase (cytochrome)
MDRSNTLRDCYNVMDVRQCARRRLPRPVFDFLDGGAEGESTARRNTEAFDDETLVPKYLVDVSDVRTQTRILGQDVDWPVICAPTGASRLFHPDGELAVARAAARLGTLYSLATGSTYSIETVAAASEGPKIFQLYIYKDRGLTEELIDRCKGAKYSALCLTIDAPVSGKRERDLRCGFGVPPKWSLQNLMSFARCPGWVAGQLKRGPLSLANFVERVGCQRFVTQSQYLFEQLDSTVTWRDVRSFIDQWGGPFAIKGIMSSDDARRAADAGVSAVMVSNHGGRQLDGAAAAIEVLPQIVEAVGDQLEIILDGGVRRGVHVLKALALGANACSVGRPYLYGLGAAGEAGVHKALNILKSELVLAMRLSGCTDINTIDRTLLRRQA